MATTIDRPVTAAKCNKILIVPLNEHNTLPTDASYSSIDIIVGLYLEGSGEAALGRSRQQLVEDVKVALALRVIVATQKKKKKMFFTT